MRKSGAYLNVYQKEEMFSDSLEEFDFSRFIRKYLFFFY